MDTSADLITRACGERIANTLRKIHPYSTAKLVHRDTGISQRTVERILDGTGAPSFENFARLLAAYPSMLLVLAPMVEWAPVAAAAVEQAAMEIKLAEMPARRQLALDAMRGV